MSVHTWSEKSKRKLSLSMRKVYAKKRRKAREERKAALADFSLKSKGDALRANGRLKFLEEAKADLDKFEPLKIKDDFIPRVAKPEFHKIGSSPNTFDAPDTIYILVNGKLQQYKLRTMPVYLPAEELK